MRGREWLWVAGAIAATGLLLVLLIDRFPDALESEDSTPSLVFYLAWLALLGGSLLMHIRHRPIAALKHVAIWAGLFLVLIGGYSYRDVLDAAYSDARARITGELMPTRGTVVGEDGVRFRAGRDGHFHIEADVDGVPITFILDTGASDVVLTLDDARSLGFDPALLNFTRLYQTANGTVRGASVHLNHVRVGPITLTDVDASVNEAPMNRSLLGMTFLKRLSGYDVRGDQLTLWR
jgi:aspartyl protease family protein